MECNNTFCLWNNRGQCTPDSEERYNHATPNQLDCPSSLRVDLEQQLHNAVNENADMLLQRNMREQIEIRKFIKSQRNM